MADNPGWRTTLCEPTAEMIEAGFKAWFGEDSPFFPSLGSDQRKHMASAFRAMLDASPLPGGRDFKASQSQPSGVRPSDLTDPSTQHSDGGEV